MKVNIVWPTPSGDRICDRLARSLSERAGWPITDLPDASADLNYDMLYIDFAQRFSDWRKTQWGAYFSHYEPDTPYKAFWWDTAAPLVSVHTYTADQYGAILPGTVIKVTPPVDEIFDIRSKPKRKMFTVGVSGFVDRNTGRKGERFLAMLAEEFAGRIDFIASGDGWPVRKVNHEVGGLPAFYNQLDAYICTSLIEGVPVPPLEALACGIPVIIPRGVGMLDELPEMAGIYRYTRGKVGEMKQSLESAIETAKSADRETLRHAVSDYNHQAWADSHLKAFEKLNMKQGNKARRKESRIFASVATDQHGGRGVYYVAYGTPAMKCAIGAINSFKVHLPEIPTAIVTTQPSREDPSYRGVSDKDFQEALETYSKLTSIVDIVIQQPDEDIGGRLPKVRIYDLAPKDWTYIAYLDADTEVIAAERLLWQIVEDGWDMVICKNPSRFHVASQMRRSDNADECNLTFTETGTDQLIQLNGGAFAFQRNPRTQAFFHCWENEWKRYGKRDQAALLRALWQHPVKLYVLGNEWNNIVRYPGTTAAWLNHYPMTARRWRGVVHHPLTSPEAWKAVEEFERTKSA